MIFFGGATIFDSFLKAHKTSETKRSSPYEKFDHPNKKMQTTKHPPCDAFYSKIRSCSLLEAGSSDYFIMLKSDMTAKQALF